MPAVNPLAGPVAAGLAAVALVRHPDPIPGIRETARLLDVSPGGVSLATRRFVDGGLLTHNHRAAVPRLFDTLSLFWKPEWVACSTVPEPEAGLVAVGTLAGAAAAAPVVAQDFAPVELLAASAAQLRRIQRAQAPVYANTIPAALVAAAPSPAFTHGRSDTVDIAGHPIAHDAIIALSIALDENRGREILDDWATVHRVW